MRRFTEHLTPTTMEQQQVGHHRCNTDLINWEHLVILSYQVSISSKGYLVRHNILHHFTVNLVECSQFTANKQKWPTYSQLSTKNSLVSQTCCRTLYGTLKFSVHGSADNTLAQTCGILFPFLFVFNSRLHFFGLN